MKMLKFLLVPMFTLALTACSSTGQLDLSKLPNIANLATTGITNPVTATNVYQVKQGYAAALQLMVSYRNYCWETDYKTLMADPIRKPVCSQRRAVVRGMQQAEANAKLAIGKLDQFVSQYPTLDASALVAAATQAVSAFQASVPKTN